MQFIYHKDAKENFITISGNEYQHLFKARRHKKEYNLNLRNLQDSYIYEYKIVNINKKEANLKLINSKILNTSPTTKLHIGWCIIDPKDIEKTLPMLNEIGVSKITFIYCQYSQKKYKINFEKLQKIVINSSQQCGRSDIIKFDSCSSLDEFFIKYPNSIMLNFSKDTISNEDDFDTIVVGCEGGFSPKEIENAKKKDIKIFGLKATNILKSQSAVVSVSAKKLL